MKKAFIAAPLLGTIIFLAAILFVSYVSQADKTEVTKIVSDAYHNRIVTILDNYRSDLKALFSVSIARSIETFLTADCWSIFSISNVPSNTCGPAPNGVSEANLALMKGSCTTLDYIDYKKASVVLGGAPDHNSLSTEELRYFKCVEATDLIKQGVCSVSKVYGITSWLNLTTIDYAFEGVSFTIDEKSSDVVGKLLWTYFCDADNSGGFSSPDVLIDKPCDSGNHISCYTYISQSGGTITDGFANTCYDETGARHDYLINENMARLCNDLVGKFLFDCHNFAKEMNPLKQFRCCKPNKFNSDGSCAEVLPGCEDGTFFINVNVSASQELFEKMPRILAQDKFGNILRSGAVGDEAFLVQVKYPFYYYYNLAFNTFDKIAYSTSSQPGVVEGYCVGQNCRSNELSNVLVGKSDLKRRPNPEGLKFAKDGKKTSPYLTNEEALLSVKTSFVDDFVENNIVCDPFKAENDLKLYLQRINNPPPGYLFKYLLCSSEQVTSFNDLSGATGVLAPPALNAVDSSSVNRIVPIQNFESGKCNLENEIYCGYIDSLDWTLEIEDKRPQFLTDPGGNRFCFHVNPMHYTP